MRWHDPREAFFFFFTLVTGPRRSLSLNLSDTRVYEPQLRARLSTTAHFGAVVALKLRAVPVYAAGPCHLSQRRHGCSTVSPSEAGSYLRLIDSCIAQLKAQGPSRTCNESKEDVSPGGGAAGNGLALASLAGKCTSHLSEPSKFRCPARGLVGSWLSSSAL